MVCLPPNPILFHLFFSSYPLKPPCCITTSSYQGDHMIVVFLRLTVSFVVQKILTLMKSQKFIFAFVSFALGDISWKKLLWLISKRLLPMFSSRILMDSYLMLRSFIHFEFIFVYGVREWSSLILLHIAVQFSQHHLLKRLSFFHCIFFPVLSKINWP